MRQEIDGHRGRKSDPLYGIRTISRCGAEKLTAWLCAQQLRAAYKVSSPVEGRRIAEKVLASFPACPIPENKRLGKTLKHWREAFLAYFDTGRANNGDTETINGLIELHRRAARSFRKRDPLPTTHAAHWRRPHSHPPQVGRAGHLPPPVEAF